jgi:starch-binding outer membrane protein, SusD/RagB family
MPNHARMNSTEARARTGGRVAGAAAGAFLLAALVATACGDITSLKQSNPGQIEAGDVYRPQNAQLLVNGAQSDFECAYTRVVTGSALLSDELRNAFAQANNYHYDRRTLPTNHPYSAGCGGPQYPGIYTSLSRARGAADTTYARMSEWSTDQVPERERMLGQLAAYGGLSLTLLGEVMCSAAIDAGPEMTSQQLFQEARSRFDAAINHATAAGDASTLHLANLWRARVRLNLGDLPGAAEDATKTPSDFLVATTPAAVDVRLQNMVFVHVNQNHWGSVGVTYRDLTLDGQPDPRVVVTDAGTIGSAGAAVWTTGKYPTVTTPIPVARYAEAQLIIAEARIAAGDLQGAAAAINAARNSGGRTGMPQYDATGKTVAEVTAQLIEERRRELYLEGRRLWDVRRLDLPLVPAPGEPYEHGGGVYGDQRCFPLPDVERDNNPNIP